VERSAGRLAPVGDPGIGTGRSRAAAHHPISDRQALPQAGEHRAPSTPAGPKPWLYGPGLDPPHRHQRRHAVNLSARIAATFNRPGAARGTVGAAAMPAASPDAEGSGAPAARLLGLLAIALAALFAFAAAPALAAPPTTTTPVISDASYTSVHVTGNLTSDGSGFGTTIYAFQYSTDEINWSPGFSQTLVGAGAFTDKKVEGNIEGLKGGIKYFVRLVANNGFFFPDPPEAEAESPGPNPFFITLPVDPPTIVSLDNASEVAYTTVTVKGKVNRPANPDPAFDVSCHFEYVTDAQFTSNPSGEGFAGATPVDCEPNPVKVPGASEVEAHLTGLSDDTTYHLRLSVSNASPVTDAKEAASTFTTLTVGPPSVISINNATEVEYGQAHAKGVVERPNTSADPAFDVSCHFEYVTDEQFNLNPPGEEFAGAIPIACEGDNPITAPGPTSVKATLGGLAASTTYHLRLGVSNQGGMDSKEAAATFITAGPIPKPGVIATDDATEVSYRTAKATGTIERPTGADPALDTSCRFEYVTDEQFNLNPPGEEFAGAIPVTCEGENPLTAASSTGPTTVEAKLTELKSGGTYHLRLLAESTGGSAAKAAPDTFTTVPGGEPTFSIAPDPIVGYTTLKVFGTGAYGLGAKDEPLQYVFEVAEVGTENWSGCCATLQLVPHETGPQNLSYEFTGLDPDTEYKYRLVLIRRSGLLYETSPEPYPTLTTRPLAEPAVTLDPVTTFTGTTAHFSHAPTGPLDSLAKAAYKTGWQLECVPACPSNQLSGTVQGEEGSKDISADVRLHANTFYGVKLLAHNSFYNVETPLQTFQTPLILPDVNSAAGASDGERGYTIEGVIDSNNSKLTECEFAWGPNSGEEASDYAYKAPCLPFPSGPDEVQDVNVDATEGQFKLSFRGQTTSDLDFDASPAEVQAALRALSSIGPAGVSVTGTPAAYVATFAGKLAGANVEPLKPADGTTPLCCGVGVSVSTATEGGIDHPVTVEAHLPGLNLGVRYHFRIFATNAVGTASSPDREFFTTLASDEPCPNEQLRRENSSNALPECRAYEQVSNPFKEGYEAILINFDGDRAVQYQSKAPDIADSGEQNPITNNYVATRSAGGWLTIPNLNGPTGSLSAAPGYVTPGSIDGPFVLSRDLLSSIMNFARQPAQQTEREAYLRHPDGTFSLIGHGNPIGLSDTQLIAGASADLSRLLYTPTNLGPTNWGPGVYEFVGTGNNLPYRIDVDNSGNPVSECGFSAAGNSISRDGRVTVSTITGGCGAPNPPADELWARINTTTSVDVSASQCTRTAPAEPCNAPADASFVSATPDGSRVFFTTSQQLVDGDTDQTNDIYACDIPPGTPAPTGKANSCAALIQISGAGSDADVEQVLATSEDGSTTYFIARGVLAANKDALGEPALAGDRNLYLWRTDATHPVGQTKFIAALPDSDNPLAQTTPDGRYLVLQTNGPLLATDTDTAADVYRYDADTDGLLRVSTAVSDTGGNDDSDGAFISMPQQGEPVTRKFTYHSSPTVSNDGSVIAFHTEQSLSPRDANDESDLYMWNSGQVSLITTGAVHGGLAEFYPGSSFAVSGSGEDVYFGTEAQLTPSDGDGKADVYDARIDGGFQPPQLGCSGETCQPAASTPPATPTSPANLPNGEGNVKPCPKNKVAKGNKCIKKSHGKHHKKKGKRKAHRTRHDRGGSK
jgi:hypothetical protein